MTILRYKEKIIYFSHIPKTGGTSIEGALRDAGAIRAMHFNTPLGYGKCCPQHIHAEIFENLFPVGFYDYGFAVIRHPMERLFSEYKWRVSKGHVEKEFDPWVRSVISAYPQKNYMLDNHLRPQSEFILPFIEVFRFEDGVGNALARVSEAVGIESLDTTTHLNKTGQEHTVELSVKTKKLVTMFYAEDYLDFNYDHNNFSDSIVLV